MNIQLLTSPQAVSFNEVARVMKQTFTEYGYNCNISDAVYNFFIPNITFNPINFATWDLMITIHTFQPNISERFRLWSQPYYTKKAWLYAVVEGKPIPHINHTAVNGKIIVPSEFCKKHIESIGLKVKTIIPHAIIHKEFETPPPETQQIKQKFKGHKILLYIGNGDPRKAIPRLIQALAILKEKRQDWVCLMHTDERIRRDGIMGGREFPPIDHYIQKLNLEHFITFTKSLLGAEFGYLGRNLITALYHLCDIHILPSYCEGFGIPLIEAGACHKTSICIDAQPMNEIVNNKCAYLVPYTHIEWTQDYPIMLYQRHIWKPEDMAETIDNALSNEKERKEKEQKNYENSLKYNYKTIYKKFLELE